MFLICLFACGGGSSDDSDNDDKETLKNKIIGDWGKCTSTNSALHTVGLYSFFKNGEYRKFVGSVRGDCPESLTEYFPLPMDFSLHEVVAYVATGSNPGTFVIGDEITSTSGVIVNEIDLSYAISEDCQTGYSQECTPFPLNLYTVVYINDTNGELKIPFGMIGSGCGLPLAILLTLDIENGSTSEHRRTDIDFSTEGYFRVTE